MNNYLGSVFSLLILTGCGSSKEKLHIFSWGDFISPSVIEEFEQKHNCQVIIDTYDSNESMYSKLKTGATGYDLIFPTHYFVEFLKHENLLEEIDLNLLPNSKNIDWEKLNYFRFEESPFYIPYMLSYTGIGFRRDELSTPPTSWNVFSKSNFKRRMTLLNDYREVIGAALAYLGYNVNTIDPTELESAYKVINGWKKNIAKFENEQYLNGLASQEYFVSHGYSTYIAQLMKESDKVLFSLPAEGGMITLDAISIPKGGQNMPLALAFINQLLDPPSAYQNFKIVQALPPILGLEFNEQEKANPALFPPQEALQKSQVIFDIGEQVSLYQDLWERILH